MTTLEELQSAYEYTTRADSTIDEKHAADEFHAAAYAAMPTLLEAVQLWQEMARNWGNGNDEEEIMARARVMLARLVPNAELTGD